MAKANKNPFSAFIFGLLFVLFGLGLLWWNEGRSVKKIATLDEGRRNVVEAPSETIDPSLEGKLAHAVHPTRGEILVDSEFGLERQGLALRRQVEMYQWKEKKRRKHQSGTRYSYRQDWIDKPIDSSRFHEQEGHENPKAWAYASHKVYAQNLKFGPYSLEDDARRELADWIALAPPSESVGDGRLKKSGNYLYAGDDPSAPKIGDTRISFQYVPENTYSIIARQQSGFLRDYISRQGQTIFIMESGTHAADAMFASAARRTVWFTWMLRIGGTVLVWIGFAMLLSPLALLFAQTPVFGRLFARSIGVIAMVLALLSALAVASLAWFWYRPLLALATAAIAAIVIWWLLKKPTAVAMNAGNIAAPPPPPPSPPLQ